MAISVTQRPSADAGNQLTYGADYGLYVPAVNARGGPNGFTIDNSMHTAAAAATYYYALPFSGASTYTWTGNLAQLAPLLVARDCRITEGALNVVTAGAGSTLCWSLFAADSAGQPAAKVADLLRFDTTATGMRQATALSPSTVLTGGRLYWSAAWIYTTSAYPAVTARTANGMYVSQRYADRPTVTGYFGNGIASLPDTSAAWSTLLSAPAAVSPTQPVGSVTPNTSYTTSPLIWFGVYNV